MSKKLPDASGFSLNLPSGRRPAVSEPVAPAPAAPQVVAAAARPAKAPRTSVPPGAKSLTFYPSKEAWLQLRMLAGRQDRTAQDLLLDALDALFRDHGLPQTARRTAAGAGEAA